MAKFKIRRMEATLNFTCKKYFLRIYKKCPHKKRPLQSIAGKIVIIFRKCPRKNPIKRHSRLEA